ncbi:MAG: RidA family protein [Clostridiaceae bacterium]|nr:RidA family protein [Clostridiaceae bacterium]
MGAEDRIKELGLTLPEVSSPIGSYVTAKRQGNTLYLSGSGPIVGGKALYQGKVGAEISSEEAYEAAKISALNLIAVLKHELGNLDKVKSIVKLLGFVACAPEFYNQPSAINGASDLLVKVFGEKGRHARSAIGVYSLPMNIPVEIEMIVDTEE